MAGRHIGMVPSVGEIIPALSVTVPKGDNRTPAEKPGISICGAAVK